VVLLAPVAEVRVRDGHGRHLLAPLAEAHEPVRVFEGQRPQQHAVDDRKDRRVRADAQRERENGDRREAGLLEQHPKSVPNVLPERFHSFTSSISQESGV
jgi:hypothetical protein